MLESSRGVSTQYGWLWLRASAGLSCPQHLCVAPSVIPLPRLIWASSQQGGWIPKANVHESKGAVYGFLLSSRFQEMVLRRMDLAYGFEVSARISEQQQKNHSIIFCVRGLHFSHFTFRLQIHH